MKKTKKRNGIIIPVAVLLLLAVTATLTLVTGCSQKGEDKDKDTVIYEETKSVYGNATEPPQIDPGVIKYNTSGYYTYGIGLVWNENDPLYTMADEVMESDGKSVYVHSFQSRKEVKELLQGCASASNYYFQQIANSIYGYDEDYFKENTVFLVYVKAIGDSVRFSLSGLRADGECLEIGLNEYYSKTFYDRKVCWLIAFTLEKEIAEKYDEYSLTVKGQDFSNGNAPDYSTMTDVEIDFDYELDYVTRSPEYTMTAVHTGMGFVGDIKTTALNHGAFGDKTNVPLAVHTFDSRAALVDFYGRFEYPDEKRGEVEAFLQSYGDEFFETHTLLTLYADQYGPDTEYEVSRLCTQANTMVIDVVRTKKGVDYTSGVDGQILAFELKKEDVSKIYYYSATVLGEVGGDRQTPPNVTKLINVKNGEKADKSIFDKALNKASFKGEDVVEPNQMTRQLPLYKFGSREELLNVLGNYSLTEEGTDWTVGYTDGFFEKSCLFVAYLRTYSSGAGYETNGIYITDESVSVNLKKTRGDDGSDSRVILVVVEIEKRYGRATDGNASVYDQDPPKAERTKYEGVNENNVYIDKYTSPKLKTAIDKKGDMFTKALNSDKLNCTDAVHIPFHYFKTYEEYRSIVGQYIKEDIYFSERDFEYKDVYLLYVDNTMVENGGYELTRDFVDGNRCTMAVLGRSGGPRVELSDEAPAWIVMFYCSKGYYEDITEFDAVAKKDLDDLLDFVS